MKSPGPLVVGFLAIPGNRRSHGSKTHLFRDDGTTKALCGHRGTRRHELRWCARGLTMWQLRIIECPRCLDKAKTLLMSGVVVIKNTKVSDDFGGIRTPPKP